MKNENKARQLLFLLLIPVVIFMYFLGKKSKKLKEIEVIDDLKKDNLEPIQTFVSSGLNDRQMKVLGYISDNGSGKVSDMVKIFSQTDRTLRRDLNKLEGMGFVKRSGSTKSVSYTLNR